MLLALAAICVRSADLSLKADAEALCSVRSPTAYVVEDGGVGFLGQRVELTPEEAFERRVKARLGSAIRDNAEVFIATADGSDAAGESTPAILGTVDCIPLEAGQYRRALAPELPARIMVRNLWVDPARRREGIARKLMEAAVQHASDRGISLLTLEVLSGNAAAIGLSVISRPRTFMVPCKMFQRVASLLLAVPLHLTHRVIFWLAVRRYEQLGFYEIDAPPVPLPSWLRGTLMLAKDIT